jgi:hypothetical protein
MLPMKTGLPARALRLVPYLAPEEVQRLCAGCRGRQKDRDALRRSNGGRGVGRQPGGPGTTKTGRPGEIGRFPNYLVPVFMLRSIHDLQESGRRNNRDILIAF